MQTTQRRTNWWKWAWIYVFIWLGAGIVGDILVYSLRTSAPRNVDPTGRSITPHIERILEEQ